MKSIIKTLLTFLILVSTQALSAQNFEKIFGSEGHDLARDGFQTSDGGYFGIGVGNSQAYAFKTDNSGVILWDSSPLDSLSGLGACVETNEGDLVVVGGSTTEDQLRLVKLSSEGELLWQTDFEYLEDTSSTGGIVDMEINEEGHFIVLMSIANSINKTGLIKEFDEDGNEIAQLDIPLINDMMGALYICDLEIASDGNYVIAVSGLIVPGGEHVTALWKWNPEGEEIWFNAQEGNWYPPAVSLTKAHDGGFIYTRPYSLFKENLPSNWLKSAQAESWNGLKSPSSQAQIFQCSRDT